jgi:type III restriction enzyme
VDEWRDGGYKGVTDTARALLNHWFKTDHRLPDGRRFEYHWAQREAVETLIYLFEVARARRQKDLVERYAGRSDLRLLQYDDFARYRVKMATGSGKTKAISLAIAWQYFNATVEGREDYARMFLVLAPNIIVFERLRADFENSACSGPTLLYRRNSHCSGTSTATCAATDAPANGVDGPDAGSGAPVAR